MVKENTFVSKFLKSNYSFKTLHLKFKLRNRISSLREDLIHQKNGSRLCKYCGCFESHEHFIFHCNVYRSERDALYNNRKTSRDNIICCLFLQNPDFAMCLPLLLITSMNIFSILLLKLGSSGTVFKFHYIHPY